METTNPGQAAQTLIPLLVPNKLHRPSPRPQLVARPRLPALLHAGWRSGRPLSLVVAPAGYGKSTLAAGWAQELLHSESVAVAWLTLDRQDNDPPRFFTYLTTSLERAVPGAGETTQRLLGLSPQPPPAALMMTLLDQLPAALASDDGAGRRLLLVLDDYHLLQQPPLHEAIDLLVTNCPPSLHLLLVTREDPPLPLSRWRVRDLLTEIRAADLRFDEDEAARFLAARSGQQLESQWIAALTRRTEGWVAGLQLAALALNSPLPPTSPTRPAHDIAAFVEAFSGSHRYIIDYLVDEVLAQLDPAVRDFLTGTAVLDRFCAPLCAAMLGCPPDDAQQMLETLEEANLFVTPLDGERRWYRYHQLFADCLRAELDPQTRAAANGRAAAWFAAQGDYPQAIDHAAAAKDSAEVARLVRIAAETAFQQGRVGRLAAWLALLPHDMLLSDPQLGLYHLLSLILSGRSQEAPPVLQQLERNIGDRTTDSQRARLLVVKAWLADITDDPQRISLAREAVAALGESDPLFSAFVAVPLGHAYHIQGKMRESVDAFRQGLALAATQGAAFTRLSLLSNLIHTLNLQGQRRQAWDACQRAIDEFVDARGNPLPPAGLPFILRAWLSYDAGDLPQAESDITLGCDLLRQAFQETMLTPLQAELPALLHAAAADYDAALDAVLAGRELALRQQYRQAARSIARLEADLHLRRRHFAPVRRWLETQPIFTGRDPDGVWRSVDALFDLTYLTYARLLLAEEQVDEARQLLALLAGSARQGQRGRALISILLLQALVEPHPQPILAEALQRAASEQYTQLILDECAFPTHGPRLAALLHRHGAREDATGAVTDLLQRLPPSDDPPAESPTASDHNLALSEPLTDQELVVLQNLAQGLSNGEIAANLVITVGTAKWHLHNIYGKLGVDNRVDAILRAQELGLA